jgi:hypothetical protein
MHNQLGSDDMMSKDSLTIFGIGGYEPYVTREGKENRMVATSGTGDGISHRQLAGVRWTRTVCRKEYVQ